MAATTAGVAPEGEERTRTRGPTTVAPVVDQVGALTAHPPAIEADVRTIRPSWGLR